MNSDLINYESNYLGSSLEQYIIFFSLLILGVLISKATLVLFKHRAENKAYSTDHSFDQVIVRVLGYPFGLFVIAIFSVIGSMFLSPVEPFARLLNNFNTVLVVAGLAWMTMRLSDGLIEEYVWEFTQRTETKLDKQLVPILQRSINISIVVIGMIILLDSFGYNITALLASLGIGGVAIAFAAREMLSDFFGGFTIFTAKPFVVGDTVKIGEVTGTVEEVRLRHTKIRNFDKQGVTIPNRKVAERNILNLSDEPARRIVMEIGLTYETKKKDIEEFREILLETVNGIEGVEEERSDIWLWEFSDSSVDLRLQYFVGKDSNWIDVKDQVNLELKEKFEDNEIEIAYPTQRVLVEDEN